MDPIQGLHHVTAVTRDAQINVDFYRNYWGNDSLRRQSILMFPIHITSISQIESVHRAVY